MSKAYARGRLPGLSVLAAGSGGGWSSRCRGHRATHSRGQQPGWKPDRHAEQRDRGRGGRARGEGARQRAAQGDPPAAQGQRLGQGGLAEHHQDRTLRLLDRTPVRRRPSTGCRRRRLEGCPSPRRRARPSRPSTRKPRSCWSAARRSAHRCRRRPRSRRLGRAARSSCSVSPARPGSRRRQAVQSASGGAALPVARHRGDPCLSCRHLGRRRGSRSDLGDPDDHHQRHRPAAHATPTHADSASRHDATRCGDGPVGDRHQRHVDHAPWTNPVTATWPA